MGANQLSEPEQHRLSGLTGIFFDSHRSFVPIRETLLQARGRPPTPGPLAELVRGRHRHALDLYLLLHAATASPPHRLSLNPEFWAFLVSRPAQSARNSRQALYRSLDTLDSVELIRSTRLGNPTIQLLDESGSGQLYVHPSRTAERYFTLPHEYWLQGLDRKLELPGKAVLLLARSLKPQGFTLPLAHAQEWYGVSPDTLRRGMRALVKADVARYTPNIVDAPAAPQGFAVRRTYKLTGAAARIDAA